MFTGYIGERRYQHELGLPVLLTLGYHQSKMLLTINKSLLSILNLTNTRQFFSFEQGLEHLFNSSLRYHGNMKSSNCVIDGRFVLKLTDFGPRNWIEKKNKFERGNLSFLSRKTQSQNFTSAERSKQVVYTLNFRPVT